MKIISGAGQVGTWLWSWSRCDKPEQFSSLFDAQSCVRVSYDRFAK